MADWMRAAITRLREGGRRHLAAGLLALGLSTLSGGAVGAADLPALGARIEGTTVSGLSSGAYMAGQMQIAHARIVTGAAIVAGGPFGCAESLFADAMPGPGTVFLNASKAVNGCMLDGLRAWGIPDPKQLAQRARRLAAEDRVDATSFVAADRVYLFSGREDRTVAPSIVAAAARFYEAIGVPAAAIRHVTDVASGHGFVTLDKGLACSRTAQPYVVDCDYDQAGDLLQHLLGPLNPRSPQLSAAIEAFDQRPFTADLAEHSLAAEGAVYVPQECRRTPGCRVHVAFHGCGQSQAVAGDAFVADSGLTAWADSNRLVVLFPQVAQSPLNPQGCWDWWGYTGRAYLTRAGVQIQAVHRMLLRLTQAR